MTPPKFPRKVPMTNAALDAYREWERENIETPDEAYNRMADAVLRRSIEESQPGGALYVPEPREVPNG